MAEDTTEEIFRKKAAMTSGDPGGRRKKGNPLILDNARTGEDAVREYGEQTGRTDLDQPTETAKRIRRQRDVKSGKLN